MTVWIGVDVGGTFTDVIVYNETSGEFHVGKVPTTPTLLEEGVGRAVQETVPTDVVGDAQYFLHGTTAGLNTLLERNGAVVGLLATRGFRDILEIRRGDREEMYDLLWRPPPPLVPRRRRLAVTERISATGEVITPLDEGDIARAVEIFGEENVTSVAIAFLNAYANPEHEIAASRALRRLGFTGDISLSHQVSGEYREYERTSTSVIDAYIRPRMGHYLRGLEAGLSEQGFRGIPLVTRSGGGAMTFREADERPFETIQSGPVAGVLGAAELCRHIGVTEAITADVGGTSFDTCLIVDGQPHVKYEGRVAGMPLQTPWIDVRSIGAGGGSIAKVDAGGLLRVGPESAGSQPGPACYGRGGEQATVTDAALVLGMLAYGELAGGVRVDPGRAEAALKPLAAELSLEVDAVAEGVIHIMTASMANAIREVTVERGQDPRRATLIPYGGAGPLFPTLLADELELTSILVPAHPGNFSAWGLLAQDITQGAAVSVIRRLDDAGLRDANAALETLFDRLSHRGDTQNSGDAETSHEAALELRYIGQEYTLNINVPWHGGHITSLPDAIRSAFVARYETLYGHALDAPIEIVAVRATNRFLLKREADTAFFQPSRTDTQFHADGDELSAYSFALGRRMPFRVFDRYRLARDARIPGPALFIEHTATTYVDVGFRAEVHPTGVLMIQRVAESR